jgi:hypothetical protein
VAPILAPLSLAWFLAKPAQTAPFLAPGPQNRHRTFSNFTPLKKPEVAQSRSRPLAPTLSPALFSHPLFAAQCSDYVRRPQSYPNLSFEPRIISFFIETISSFNALPLQANLGLLFLFLLIPSFSQPPL